MTKQIEFLERCKAVNLHSGSLFDWLARVETLQSENAALKEQVAQLESRNFNLTLELEKDKEQTSNLVRVLNEMNGPAHMGEPVYPYRHAILESLENQLTTLQSKSAVLVDALESAQRLLRDNHDAIRNNLQAGFERIQATEIMTEIRTALSAFKGEK